MRSPHPDYGSRERLLCGVPFQRELTDFHGQQRALCECQIPLAGPHWNLEVTLLPLSCLALLYYGGIRNLRTLPEDSTPFRTLGLNRLLVHSSGYMEGSPGELFKTIQLKCPGIPILLVQGGTPSPRTFPLPPPPPGPFPMG